MLLRRTVNRAWSLVDNEDRLRPEVAKLVFRGPYLRPSRIAQVDLTSNRREDQGTSPYLVRVTRTHKDGTRSYTGDDPASTAYGRGALLTVLSGLSSISQLERATHIEQIARRIKVTVAAVALAGAALGGLAEAGAFSSTEASHHSPAVTTSSSMQPCTEAIAEGEALIPIQPDRVDAAKRLGEGVCDLVSAGDTTRNFIILPIAPSAG